MEALNSAMMATQIMTTDETTNDRLSQGTSEQLLIWSKVYVLPTVEMASGIQRQLLSSETMPITSALMDDPRTACLRIIMSVVMTLL